MNDLTTTAPTISTSETRFGSLRSLTIGTKVWFVATDVCKALGIQNSTDATNKLDSTDLIKAKISEGRGRSSTLVSESGLYDLVLQSRKPIARAFRNFLTSEVIPSIFKHGIYVAGQGQMTDAQLKANLDVLGGRLIAGTRAERSAQIAADVAKFTTQNGRAPTSRERFWVEKP